jgi:hypothetical protein
VNFAINLRGHGSIVIADNVDFIRSISYIGRDILEDASDWACF